MSKCISLVSILFLYLTINAQNGARVLSLGGIDPVLQGPVSIVTNPAGIHGLESIHLLSGYRFNYIPSLQSIYIGAIYPFQYFVAGLSISRFGDAVFHKTDLAINAAHSVGNTALGIRFNYSHYGLQSLGNKGIVLFDIGGITKLAPQLYLGASLFNAFLSDITQEERAPVVLRIGIRYQPQPYLNLISALEKNTSLPARISLGVEYDIFEKIVVRCGIKQQPLTVHGGFGMQWNSFTLEYGMERHPQIGVRQDLTIQYVLKIDEKD